MNNRLQLHNLLLSIGGPNVYFQAPGENFIKYPAIKYSLNKINNDHANNSVYHQDTSYQIIVMSKNPDEPIVGNVSTLPKCSFERYYVKDNIHHTVFNLYY